MRLRRPALKFRRGQRVRPIGCGIIGVITGFEREGYDYIVRVWSDGGVRELLFYEHELRAAQKPQGGRE